MGPSIKNKMRFLIALCTWGNTIGFSLYSIPQAVSRSAIPRCKPQTCLFAQKPPPQAYDDHAAQVFALMDVDQNGRIDRDELQQVLKLLNIEASQHDIAALFKHLDLDGNQEIEFDEFLSWYVSAASRAQTETHVVMDALLSRRTVNDFDSDSTVPESVLRNAILAATYAPNHRMTEPWNFIILGPQSIKDISALNAESITDPAKALAKRERWQAIPGWCVVTSLKHPNDKFLQDEDYAATCCAIQNFMLAMWAEGVGTKWTTGPITQTPNFAKICGINLQKHVVVGCIWYGFAKGGLASVPTPKRKRGVDDVMRKRP